MKLLKILFSIILASGILAGVAGYWLILKDLPSVAELRQIEATKLSRVIAVDGSTLAYFPPEGRIMMAEDEIPERIKQAFIAAEDATFHQHAGLDYKRILAAAIADIRAASFFQGASTITQQVVRSYLLTNEKTITRKLREIVLALRIEKTLSKEQLLTLYLGRLYLGSGAYGVEAAALRYFDRSCKDLDLAEISMLAGLAPAPAKYSPLNDFTAAKRRQRYVLERMLQEGFITESELADAYAEPLRITGEPYAQFSRHPYVTEYVKGLAEERFGADILTKGIGIQTTIDPAQQVMAEKAVFKGVVDLELRQGKYRGPVRGLSESKQQRLLALQTNQIDWQGGEAYKLYWARVEALSPLRIDAGYERMELKPESYSWINPKGSWQPADHLRVGDMIKICRTDSGLMLAQNPQVQAALVAFDITTGQVTALVGGADYAGSQFNRAVYAKRQSGSAIKPFIYAAALDNGMTPATIVFDTPITYKSSADEETWRPKNYEDRFYGPTSLRTGLVLSRNVVTIKILKEMGLSYTLKYLNRFGMGKDLPRNLSLALGSGVITPFDLARAYAVFPNYGRSFDPYLIEYINQPETGPIYTAKTANPLETGMAGQDEELISEQTAYIITNILSEVVSDGTGWRARDLNRPVAGKTGTSDDNRDAWFIGYTPDILCGVWVGYDNMLPLGDQETGSRAASPIFVDFMKNTLADSPVKDFKVPDGVVFARVDTVTGKLAGPNSQNVRFECFKEGALPPQQEDGEDDLMLKEIF